ncbi:sulfite exporter TauE/SafE family protein [Marinimicrobium sp. C6131]|uniref:sulfite exporter TauE/SafE family protein n=1 Tax=Marinimicrobium sp. C6131 TaxID=3022676 RepID=UPI00223CDADE|nr:sulfite exporter TauE/SafE family protein [Marinimicrobium sp. C6131]UZJ44735.1 sulfite exporter TauE/SafE family protein [Marinimicrobium sp. C6131]
MMGAEVSVWGAWLAAWMLGLFSSAHCVGMCGGIMGALSAAIPAEARGHRWRLLFAYNVGRITSYTLMGLLAGLLAGGLTPLDPVLRLVAGLLLIAMGLYLAGWWRGLTWLERGGAVVWRRLQPLGKSLLPVRRPRQALLLGALWGWLPCGLVYTALAYALAQGNLWVSGGTMLAFGLGTLPAVLAAGVMALQLTRLLQRRGLRIFMALAIILFGLWTLWPAVGGGHAASSGTPSSHHSHHH